MAATVGHKLFESGTLHTSQWQMTSAEEESHALCRVLLLFL